MLNPSKCEIFRSSVKFLGHILDKQGVRADPDKTSAILKMESPKSVSDVRRFMGLVNQLGKFSPKIAEYSQAIRELLRSNRSWTWGPAQEESFSRIKEEFVKPTVLTHYNPQADTKVSADASSFGLGAVLMQKKGEHWIPVVYASRSLTDRNYAQIEKEALAATWECEKFAMYILGRQFTIESDHKPLLNEKHLDALPPRILRFRNLIMLPFTSLENFSTLLMLSQELPCRSFQRTIQPCKTRQNVSYILLPFPLYQHQNQHCRDTAKLNKRMKYVQK